MDIRHGWIQGRRHSRKPSSRLSAEHVGFTPGLVLLARHRACLLAVQAGTLAELELDLAAQPQPSGPPWSQRAPRESWWQGGPSGLVMRLPVEPGCGLLMLEPRWVRAGVRTSRKGDWMLAAPSDSSSADTVLSARAAGAGPSPRPSGHFAQNGHGQTLRDLALHWKEPHCQDRDAGCSLSEAGSFDRQGQAWRGPAMRVIPASV